MPDVAQIELALWNLSTILTAILLARVVATGLARQYPGATFYLAVTLARSLALRTITWLNPGYSAFQSPLYSQVYLYTLPLLWASYFGVVYEIYSKVLEGYKGLSVLSRRTLTLAVCLSFLVSVSTVWPDLNYAQEFSKQLRTTLIVDRAVVFSLLSFLVLNALFLTWYPIPLRRNLLTYSFVFALLFFSIAGAYFYRNQLGHAWTRIASASLMAANCLSLLIWVLRWNRSGEKVVSLSLAVRSPESQRKLLDQLQQLNAILERKPIG